MQEQLDELKGRMMAIQNILGILAYGAFKNDQDAIKIVQSAIGALHGEIDRMVDEGRLDLTPPKEYCAGYDDVIQSVSSFAVALLENTRNS